MVKLPPQKPKFELDVYRRFIREATPYVSLVAGRRLSPQDADKMSDKELTALALLIDERAEALGKNIPTGRNN